MSDPVKAIIFDFGNVLSLWDPHRLYRRFFPSDEDIDAFLSEIDFYSWNLEQDRGRSFAEGVAALSARFPHYSHLIHAYDQHWEDSIAGAVEGTVAIVERLARAGHPLYILTNFSVEKFALMHRRYEFLDLFDNIIISAAHKLIKPDPAIYYLTLDQINRVAAECVFIDDALPNIETARQLGFVAVHYQSPAQLDMELQRLGILPGPD